MLPLMKTRSKVGDMMRLPLRLGHRAMPGGGQAAKGFNLRRSSAISSPHEENAMPTAYLADRSFVRIVGEDARAWLQGLVTCNMEGLEAGTARFGALLSPQGKILFDFIASLGRVDHDPDKPAAIYLETARSLAPELAKRLAFYRLRAKVRVEDLSVEGEHGKAVGVAVAWGDGRAYQGDAI